MLKFHEATCLSLLFRLILSDVGSDVTLFLAFIRPFCFMPLLDSLYYCIF